MLGCGCPKCAGKLSISHDEFIEKVEDKKNKNIEIIGTYIDSHTQIECKCKICNNFFKTMPYCIERGNGCKKCADKEHGIKSRKSQEVFLDELHKVNSNIEVLEKYIKSSSRITVKCLTCHTIWNPIAYSLLRGCGCPTCNSSKLELKTERYLKDNHIEYKKYQKYENLLGIGNRQLSYDFYLPQYNFLIECQGAQHEHPVEYFGGTKKFVIQKTHDTRKRRYAHDHNINLLEIWYYEENKIDKILKQTLNNLKLESVETTGVA